MKFLFILITSLTSIISSSQDRAAWMKDAKFGIMIHYLSDWRARADSIKMNPDEWNKLIDRFDVDALAAQVKSTGAGYLIFTIGQNSGYYVAPNKTFNKITATGQKFSKRDLIADLSAALKKQGLKFIVYLPSGAPAGDSLARTKLQWKNGPHPNKEFQNHWEAIIRDWSLRWGNKIDGWWFDGCYWPNFMYRSETAPNFASFAAAARAGNPDNAVAFNPGVVPRILSMTPYEDYTAGENSDMSVVTIRRANDGKIDGMQIQVLSYMGTTWGMGVPRFTVEKIIEWTKMVVKEGGAMTWDVPVQKDGKISEAFVEQLKAVGNAVR